MNLTELKNTPVSGLVQFSESMGLENLARAHKKDIIFANPLKAHAKVARISFGDGVLEIPDRRFRLPAAVQTALISLVRTTSMSPVQSAASTCAPAIPFPEASHPPRRGKRYSRC